MFLVLFVAVSHVEIITYVNDGFMDFFCNWHAHYKKLNLPYNLTVYSLDPAAYETLNTHGIQTIHWGEKDLHGNRDFGKKDYKLLVQNKPSIITHHIKQMKSKDILIWFDTDTVWLKDPLKDFNDCKVSASWDMNQYCTGFMIFKNTHYAQFIINKWVEVVKTTDRRDQPSFNSLKFKQVCRLSNLSFPSGNLNRSKNEMTVYHNNWIVGHKNKKNRFIQKQLWQPSPICRYVR